MGSQAGGFTVSLTGSLRAVLRSLLINFVSSLAGSYTVFYGANFASVNELLKVDDSCREH
jgi:hypothetical protein